MIKISNLYKSFDGVSVLNNVNLEFKENMITSIIGPSGTGKSTLLRCILGLETKDSGNIRVNGVNLEYSPKALFDYRTHLGVVFQELHLFKHMTILKNITYALIKSKGKSINESNSIALDMLASFNLLDQKDKYPSQLSGGQKQRVAIIRALALQPQFLLLDEPTSALDAESISDFIDLLKKIKKTTGLIIITHDLNFAKRVSDEIVLMNEGSIVEQQTTQDFFESPKTQIAKRYIESQLS